MPHAIMINEFDKEKEGEPGDEDHNDSPFQYCHQVKNASSILTDEGHPQTKIYAFLWKLI